MNEDKAKMATETTENVPQAQALETVPHPAEETTPQEPVTESTPEAAEWKEPAGGGLSREQIAELEAGAAKAAENWDRYLRAVADLDNFKKRAAREKQEASRYANESLLSRLVPVLDTFDMALAAASGSQGTTIESLKTGITMIRSQLKSALDDAGLEEVDASGKPFDPNWHEAVSQQECADVPEGQVVQQLRKGYKYRERLLRPASVVVAKTPATPAS